MTDRPILFSAPMVHALLEGRKTQTRRLAWRFREVPTADDGDGLLRLPSPWQRVQPGDRLWVRETWNLFALSRDGENSYPWTGKIPRDDPRDDPEGRVQMVVDYATAGLPGTDAGKGPWRVAIHMPRWASRLTLTVTDVRVQKLRDITEAEALAEGIAYDSGLRSYHVPHLPHPDPEFPVLCRPTPREMFAALWDTLHGPGAFLANPHVIALIFTVEQKNIDA